jgi:transmembrane sensor
MPSHPESRSDDPALPEEIQLGAADWLVRQDHGLTAEERDEFERWLARDARHAAAYRELCETWGLLDQVPASRVPLPLRRIGMAWWAGAGLAAAAAVVVAVWLPSWNSASTIAADQRATTAIGGFERLTLPDGSVVRLNTASAVAVAFAESERRITLESGEASFEVVKDAVRPFIVRAGPVEVRAIGTAFNVRQEGDAVDVLVTEGRVQVDDVVSKQSVLPPKVPATRAEPPAGSRSESGSLSVMPVLSAGQRVRIANKPMESAKPVEVLEVPAPVVARVLAWHDRHLEFSDEPLEHIAAEFNRYNQHRLVIADPVLGTQRFGGKFPANDFATLVRLLEANFGVIVERRENETVLRRALAPR